MLRLQLLQCISSRSITLSEFVVKSILLVLQHIVMQLAYWILRMAWGTMSHSTQSSCWQTFLTCKQAITILAQWCPLCIENILCFRLCLRGPIARNVSDYKISGRHLCFINTSSDVKLVSYRLTLLNKRSHIHIRRMVLIRLMAAFMNLSWTLHTLMSVIKLTTSMMICR